MKVADASILRILALFEFFARRAQFSSAGLPNRGEFFTQGDDCRSTFGEDAMRQLIVFQKF